MLCYLLVPLLQAVLKKVKNVSLFIVIFITLGCAISIAVSESCSIFYFLYFSVGFLGGKIRLLDNVNLKSFLIYTSVFFTAVIGRLLLQRLIDGTYIYLTYVSISHFFVGTWFVVLFAFLFNRWNRIIAKIANAKVIKILDRYSFYVYLVHGVFCTGTFNVYQQLPVLLATVVFIISTILSAVVLKTVVGKITKPLLKNNRMIELSNFTVPPVTSSRK